MKIQRSGSRPSNKGPAEWFTGRVRVDTPFKAEDPGRMSGASVTGAGSMFLVHMKQTPPRNYREAYPTPDESRRLKALLDHLYNEGCSIISSGACVFSTPMTEAEIDTLVGTFKSGFAKLASMG
jgi:glutamate-1-semialdehyde aminotransferase